MNQSEVWDKDIERLEQDLSALSDQIHLCVEVIKESSSSNSSEDNEALKDMIGFLEACLERMPDLIESGASGMLSEELFNRTLTINDALQKVLNAEKQGILPDLGDFMKNDNNENKEKSSNLLDLNDHNNNNDSKQETSSSSVSSNMMNDLLTMSAPIVNTNTTTDNNVFDSFNNRNNSNGNSSTSEDLGTPPSPPPPPPILPPNDTAPIDAFLNDLNLNVNIQRNINSGGDSESGATTANTTTPGSGNVSNSLESDIDALFSEMKKDSSGRPIA